MNRLSRVLLAVICALGLTTGALASASVIDHARSLQPQDVPTQLAAMRKLNFMVGRWAGSGWNLNQSGQRV